MRASLRTEGLGGDCSASRSHGHVYRASSTGRSAWTGQAIASIAKTTLEDASRYVLPFLVVLVGVIIATAYIPSLVTFLPRLVLR